MALLAIPAIFIFAPLIQFFPVGLGLKMLVISCVFTVLHFGLLLPVFAFYRMKGLLGTICLLLAVFFFVKAHLKSDFSEERKKPDSLVYYKDADTGKTFWVTYDRAVDEWTRGYLGDNPEKASKYLDDASYSKYGTPFSLAAKAPEKQIPDFDVVLREDTLINNLRHVRFALVPKRKVNLIGLYNPENVPFQSLEFNGQKAKVSDSIEKYRGVKITSLVNYYVSDSDSLEVKYTVSNDVPVSFKVMEYSFDLMTNPEFNMAKRLGYIMPKPFVITDAVAVKRTFVVDSLKGKVMDSVRKHKE
jgi:hypothetical protein